MFHQWSALLRRKRRGGGRTDRGRGGKVQKRK